MIELLFGTQLQKLRKEKGVTQEQIAEHMGVSAQAISKWENGSYPNGDLLPRLADYFGVSIDYLYGREKTEVSLEQQVMESIRDLDSDDKWKYSERFEQAFRYIWAMVMAGWPEVKQYYDRTPVEGDVLTAASITTDAGFSYMRLNSDLEFFSMMKEPKDGFASFFKVTDELVELFAFLGKKENLQILFYMLSLDNAECVSIGTVAKRLKISEECVEKALDYLSHFNFNCMLAEAQMIDEYDKKKKIYTRLEAFSSMPLLLFAAADAIINPPQCFQMQMANRGKGWLDRNTRTKEK